MKATIISMRHQTNVTLNKRFRVVSTTIKPHTFGVDMGPYVNAKFPTKQATPKFSHNLSHSKAFLPMHYLVSYYPKIHGG